MEKIGEKKLLETLEKLEKEAERFAEQAKAQKKADARKKRIEELQAKVRELEAVKRNLLRQTSITTVAGKIIRDGLSARDSSGDNSGSTVLPAEEQLRLFTEQRKFEAFLQAYRLTGISVVKCDQGVLLIELVTSCNGRYYESYYIEITDSGDNKTLSHHTIPYFIPVMSYFDSYLAGKVHLHGFLLRVMQELNGFVSRRQQALEVESVHKKYLRESVVATMSYDLIQLVTKEIDVVDINVKFWYVVRLIYDNQANTRPIKVRCRVDFAGGSQEIDIIKDIKMYYKNDNITTAFTKVMEIVCQTSQISTTSHTTSSSSSNDSSNKTNNTTQ